MLERVFERKEWKFFAVLPRAAPGLALAWWLALLLRGGLPAAFAVAMGVLVGAVERGNPLAGPLALAGAIFILLQVLSPIHQAVSANLGDRTAAWLYDRLTEACVRPPGMAHLEDAKLASDLTVARDFDLGMTGPPLTISMDFIAGGMAEMVGGIACALILLRYAWWAPILLAGAWAATHWLLRESAVWRDRNTEEVRSAQRDADYAYRLAVDPPASKELRLFGLAGWTIDRFIQRRTRLHALQYEATRLRERPVLWIILLVIASNPLVVSSLAIVGQNGAGKTTLAKLLCRLYDPQTGAIEIDGVDVREFELASWRSRLTAVFQDFTRFELPLRDNVAPAGAPDGVVQAALDLAGAVDLASLDTVLASGYDRGTEPSGGQGQRIALARALCALQHGTG